MFFLENDNMLFVHISQLRKKEQAWSFDLASRMLKFCAPEVKKSFMQQKLSPKKQYKVTQTSILKLNSFNLGILTLYLST